MKNRWERRGDVAVIFVAYKGETHEVLVDFDDLKRAQRYTWRLNLGRHSPYVCADAPGQRGKKLWLHKLILRAGVDTKVDHRNFNGLDNRKANLRRKNHSTNALHMRRALPTNQCGERGVVHCPDKKTKPWRAMLQFRTRKRHLGYFATKELAARAVLAELERRGLAVEEPTAEDYERAEEAVAIASRMGGRCA